MYTQTKTKIIPSQIPQELKTFQMWTLWGLKEDSKNKDGKPSKVPYFGPGTTASISDPTTWLHFNEAEKMVENPSFGGINFAFTTAHNYIGIDLDRCVNESGEISQTAKEIVSLLNSYTEYSPSNTGIRIIVKAPDGFKIEDRNDQFTGIEIYQNNHFLSITGRSLNINEKIEERSDEILHIIQKMMHPSAKEKMNVITEEDLQRYTGHTEDAATVLKRMFINNKQMPNNNRTYGEYYEELYKYGYIDSDESTDDWRLACELVYQCAGDLVKAKDILETAAIYHSRDKWHEQRRGFGTYADMTLFNALRRKKSAIDKLIAKKQASQQLKAAVKSEQQEILTEQKAWWIQNANGTRSFNHYELVKAVVQKISIVRYPDAHSQLYFFNVNKGVYEEDKSGRQLNYIIRSFDTDLKTSHIREVSAFIADTSPIVNTVDDKHIAVNNGLIDLETFQLKPFTPSVFLTYKIGTNYNPDAYDSFIESTLEKVTAGYKPSIENIKEMFACVVYPKILVPKMFFLYGRSAHNGKSSIINMIHSTFNREGNLISAITPQKLANNTFAGSSLRGKIANAVDDLPSQPIEDSGVLKTILTGGYVDVEGKGEGSETVKLTATIIAASNFYPDFRESGKQINRRLHILPFDHDFSKDPDCKSDSETIRAIESENAREYVLKLAVDALKRMLLTDSANKLTSNPKAEETALAFAAHNDPLADYFAEHDEIYFDSRPGKVVESEYRLWCSNNHALPMATKHFKERVCTEYNMDHKQKRVIWNGQSISCKGFKSRKN